MEYLCSICDAKVIRGRYYCYVCYKKYRTEIESKQDWTRFLQNEEKKRRRQLLMRYVGCTEDGTIWQVENRKTSN